MDYSSLLESFSTHYREGAGKEVIGDPFIGNHRMMSFS
jgi:hypothetical protein